MNKKLKLIISVVTISALLVITISYSSNSYNPLKNILQATNVFSSLVDNKLDEKVQAKTNTVKPTITQSQKSTESVSNDVASTILRDERDFFARLVSSEAAGESFEGKLAVATVVMNRVKINKIFYKAIGNHNFYY